MNHAFFLYTKALKLLKGEMKNIDQMGNLAYWQLCRCYFDIHHPPKYWWRPSTLWHFKSTPRWHWSQATVQCILLRSDALTLLQTTQTPSWVVPKQAKDRNPQTTRPKVAAVNLLALDAPGHTGMSYVYTPMNMICFFDTWGEGGAAQYLSSSFTTCQSTTSTGMWFPWGSEVQTWPPHKQCRPPM